MNIYASLLFFAFMVAVAYDVEESIEDIRFGDVKESVNTRDLHVAYDVSFFSCCVTYTFLYLYSFTVASKKT